MVFPDHVDDRSDLDPGEIHRHDQLAYSSVWRPAVASAHDQVAKVGDRGEARPDFLTVDDEVAAVPDARNLMRRVYSPESQRSGVL